MFSTWLMNWDPERADQRLAGNKLHFAHAIEAAAAQILGGACDRIRRLAKQ
jgi:hypothetical protein